MRLFISIAAIAWCATACAPTVKTQALVPPRSLEASTLRSIVVVPFGGVDGTVYASELRATLQNRTVDGERYFSVSSDGGMMGFAGAPQDIDAVTAAARAAGVQAIYFGDITSSEITSETRTEEKSKCVEWDGIFDCERREKYMAQCTKLKANFSVVPQVLNVELGRVAFSDVFTGSADYDWCDDGERKKSDAQLLAEARADTLHDVARAVAPYYKTVSINLKREADNLAPEFVPMFDVAVQAAESGRLNDGCATWVTLAPDGATASVALLYNLGVCAEVASDWDEAIRLYTAAQTHSPEPDNMVNEALTRVYGAQRNQRIVRQNMGPGAPVPATAASPN